MRPYPSSFFFTCPKCIVILQKIFRKNEKKACMFGGSVLSYLSWQQDKTYPGVAKFGIALEWGSRGRWFESSHSDHVGASCVSLAPTFLKVRARSRHCSSFPNRNRLRWVAIWVRRFAADLSRYGEISILTVPSTSEQSPLCSSFPTATRCVGLAVGVLPCGPHPNISGSSRIRRR